MLGRPTQVCNVPAPMWHASALLVVARERHQSCTQLAAAASTLRQAHGYLPGSYPWEPVGQVVPSRWEDICRHVPIDAARARVCVIIAIINVNVLCVCIDYEAMLNVLMEALAQITQHISILYTLLQSR